MTRPKKVLTRNEMAEMVAAHLSKAFHDQFKVTVKGRFLYIDRGDGRRMYAGFVLPHDDRSDLQKLADAGKED